MNLAAALISVSEGVVVAALVVFLRRLMEPMASFRHCRRTVVRARRREEFADVSESKNFHLRVDCAGAFQIDCSSNITPGDSASCRNRSRIGIVIPAKSRGDSSKLSQYGSSLIFWGDLISSEPLTKPAIADSNYGWCKPHDVNVAMTTNRPRRLGTIGRRRSPSGRRRSPSGRPGRHCRERPTRGLQRALCQSGSEVAPGSFGRAR